MLTSDMRFQNKSLYGMSTIKLENHKVVYKLFSIL